MMSMTSVTITIMVDSVLEMIIFIAAIVVVVIESNCVLITV